jgi:homoserine O-acetyltransferase
MNAMLTYRTRASYERRFGRTIMEAKSQDSDKSRILSVAEVHRQAHNAGHRSMKENPLHSINTSSSGLQTPKEAPLDTQANGSNNPTSISSCTHEPPLYAAHSYLRYQADKFNERFDANCYIALSRKMDGHDVSRGRGDYESVVRSIRQPTLVIGKATLYEDSAIVVTSGIAVDVSFLSV